jgi:preprotein translocase subunit YajC
MGVIGKDMNANTTVIIVYIVLFVGVYYVLIWRPQQKARKANAEMMAALMPGDEVLTAAGVIGRIVSILEEEIHIEVADGVILRFAKGAIVSRRTHSEASADE